MEAVLHEKSQKPREPHFVFIAWSIPSRRCIQRNDTTEEKGCSRKHMRRAPSRRYAGSCQADTAWRWPSGPWAGSQLMLWWPPSLLSVRVDWSRVFAHAARLFDVVFTPHAFWSADCLSGSL